MKRIEIGFLLGLIVLYVAGYALIYANRKPAANLAYWAYTEDSPEWVEDCFYYGFYPLYFIHQRVFHIGRHIWDRPVWVIPPGFEG